MLKQGVAGAMFWSLDLDDFTGKACNIGPYPVLKALGKSVKQTEGKQLTAHVDPKIRYLFKYTGGTPACLGGSRWWNWAAPLLLMVYIVFRWLLTYCCVLYSSKRFALSLSFFLSFSFFSFFTLSFSLFISHTQTHILFLLHILYKNVSRKVLQRIRKFTFSETSCVIKFAFP